VSYPDNLKYTKEHEWVLAKDGEGTIGITDHAQHELGDIVYVDLPKPGDTIEKGHTLGSVESVKAVSDIYAPVSGEVIAVNELLSQHPEKLNEDPHGAAWLLRVKLAEPAELNELMKAADYEKYVGAE
jgi:glycine cleavage system H protein